MAFHLSFKRVKMYVHSIEKLERVSASDSKVLCLFLNYSVSTEIN